MWKHTKYTSIRERICKLYYNHVIDYKAFFKGRCVVCSNRKISLKYTFLTSMMWKNKNIQKFR